MRPVEDQVLEGVDRQRQLEELFVGLTGQEGLVMILFAYGWSKQEISLHLGLNRNWVQDRFRNVKKRHSVSRESH